MGDYDWIGPLIQLGGAAVGQAASQMDKNAAMKLIAEARDEFGKINVPKLQELFLQQQGPSAFGGIHDDPTYRAQQSAADAQLDDVIRSGGLTLADKAALTRIQNRTARTAAAGRRDIEQRMAARGTLDSGAQLASHLAEQQQQAELAADAGRDTAAAAQARMFGAIKERARLAGEGLDRDYRRQADAARAADTIAAGNTAIANAGKTYNAGLPQQNFNNELKLAGAKVGPAQDLAGIHAGEAKNTQQFWQGAGNTAAAGFNAYNEQHQPKPTDWAGSSQAPLAGPSTKPARQKELLGYDDQGQPIYGHRSAS